MGSGRLISRECRPLEGRLREESYLERAMGIEPTAPSAPLRAGSLLGKQMGRLQPPITLLSDTISAPSAGDEGT